MSLKAFATLLVGFALVGPVNAQSENVPPNAVEDQSFSARQATEPQSTEANSYAFEQLSVPLDAQQAIPMAPRTNKATEAELVAAPTRK
jgi:hypothetical protein